MLDVIFVFIYGMFLVSFASFLVRMIFSWIAPESDNPIYRVALFFTEIFVAPVRIFMNKHGLLTDFPIDMSVMFGYLLMILLQSALVMFL